MLDIKIEISKNLKEKPNEDQEIEFGTIFTDHMFKMDYEEGKGWINPRIEEYKDFEISPAAMVFHYGQTMFEGMKAYLTVDGRIVLFRPKKISKEQIILIEDFAYPRYQKKIFCKQ